MLDTQRSRAEHPQSAPAASDALTQVAYALNLRGETADLPLTVGDQFEAYADDPDGYFRLGVTRVYQGDDRFAVTLRLYAAGWYDLLAAGRDEWRVYATRGDDALAVEADDRDAAAWRLAGSFTLGDLAGISFAAELIPPE